MSHRSHLGSFACIGLLISFCVPLVALAVGSGSIPAPVAPRSAEAEYNQALKAKEAKQFEAAVVGFRRAVDIRPNFPEAWNELGFALRQAGQLAEALKAYDQALRLRPDFPEALEYQGEAYVKMGRLDDAKGVLGRLKTLDPARAQELEATIRAGM